MRGAPPAFGELLRRLRSVAGLSQEDLAGRSGVSRNGISDLERGLYQAPRFETVRMLADALTLSEDERAALIAAARPMVWSEAPAARRPLSLVSLPAPLTRLIGRETELAALSAELQDHNVRLLTVTGPGGVGKTRLALAAAAEFLDDFPDGVWFVDLAPLNDPMLVLPTVARTLGLREGSDRSLADVVSVSLAAKQVLLVLDNYEHLLAAASVVSDLLRAGPKIVVLVTSREPLRLRGEQEVAISPLPVPEHHDSYAVLAQNPAVRLFVHRAKAVQRDFDLTDENAGVVAAICRQLDGLPLAIELAAARVKVLPPSALLARLETRLPLLVDGSRDAPIRLQTMRNAIAWSYELLTRDEQHLFRRLSVFVGGFTPDGAEAIASDVTPSLLDLVFSLVDKSLLRQEADPGGEPRYLMLETVREFGLERLEASGEEHAVRTAHATHFLALAERKSPELYGPRGHVGLALEREHGNV